MLFNAHCVPKQGVATDGGKWTLPETACFEDERKPEHQTLSGYPRLGSKRVFKAISKEMLKNPDNIVKPEMGFGKWPLAC